MAMIKVNIVSRYDMPHVLYTAEVPESTPPGLRMRAALEKAAAARADLRGADLRRADLHGADLHGADLRGADLGGADLRGAYLRGADLGGADLRGAYLRGADLRGADLRRADLHGADLRGARMSAARMSGSEDGLRLIGDRPYIAIGPLGSRADTLQAFITDVGVYVCAGCFFDTLDAFKAAVLDTHGDNAHAREYAAAIALIEVHAREWTPVKEPT